MVDSSDRDSGSGLSALIARFLQELEDGKVPDREQLVREHPEHAEDLRAFFADHDRMRAAAEPLTLPLSKSPAAGARLRYVGDYELIEELARGGMGVVYRARQVSLHRTVAIKMILAGGLAGAEDVKRFKAEAEAAGRLEHPGIVPIYEIGEHEGHHYFSMRLVDGRDLGRMVAESPLPTMEAARLVEKVAEAIQYAHGQGVLHRDLKPSNVIVDAHKEPHVTDFGLAKRLDAPSELTATGQVLGTPSYMPPEQAAGQNDAIDARSDVYSLGAILYELVTGRPPFRAESQLATLRQVLDPEVDVVSPRLLNPAVERDLETIVEKCLERDPERRYASAAELGRELLRFQRGEPIQARPVGRVERLFRWCRRHRLVAALTAAVALLMVAVAVVASVGYLRTARALQREARARADAQAQRDEATRQGERAESNLYLTRIHLADRAWREADLELMDRQLDPYAKGGVPDPRGWEWYYLRRLAHATEPLSGTERTSALAFAHDGQELWSLSPTWARRWEVATWKNVEQLSPSWVPVPPGVRFDAVSAVTPDGGLLAYSAPDGRVEVFDTTARRVTPVGEKRKEDVKALAFSPDGGEIAIAWKRGAIEVRAVEDGRLLLEHPGFVAPSAMAYSPDGGRLAAVGVGGQVQIYQGESVVATLPGQWSFGAAVVFSPDGQQLAVGYGGFGNVSGSVRVWDLATRQEVSATTLETSARALAFSPDGRTLAVAVGFGAERGEALLVDVATGAIMRRLRGQRGQVSAVCFSPDGASLAMGGWDGARVWTLGVETGWDPIPELPWGVTRAIVLPDGERLATARMTMPAGEYAVELWNLKQGKPLRAVGSGPGMPRSMAVAPNGERLAVLSRPLDDGKGEITILRLDGGPARSWEAPAATQGVAFLSDEVVVSVETNRLVRWILPGIERPIHLGASAANDLELIAVSPDGGWIAAGGQGVALFAVEDDVPRLAATLPGMAVETLVFSPDGATLAIGSRSVVELWDVATQKQLHELKGHVGFVGAVAFDPTGRTLVTGGQDGTVRLWDVGSGEERLTLPAQDGMVTNASFALGGESLVTTSMGGSAMMAGEARVYRSGMPAAGP